MADINTPKEFLQEAMNLVDKLNADKEQLKRASADRSWFENEVAETRRGIEREKTKTVESRRYDIDKSYTAQIKDVDYEIGQVEKNRQKARSKGVEDRVTEQTAGIRAEIAAGKEEFRVFCKNSRLPLICRSRFYYILFYPSSILDFLLLAVIFAVFAGLIFLAAQQPDKKLLFGAIALFIAVVVLYFVIWTMTRGKYPAQLKSCKEMLASIRQREKAVNKIARNIRSDKNDSFYDLTAFDNELADLTAKRNSIESQKAAALYRFENETKQQILSEIEQTHSRKLADLQEKQSAAAREVKVLTDRISENEGALNSDYVQYIGAGNMNHDKISRMIEMVSNEEAASVSEAVSRLSLK